VADPDPSLRRIERNAMLACAAMAIAAWIWTRGSADAPSGVFAGGALVAISYRGIKAGIDVLVGTMSGGTESIEVSGQGRRSAAIGLVKFFTRYAILTAIAYVIMARLRLPPVAIVAGASSLVIAVMLEAFRPLGRNPPRNDH
jgi:hypothetical protein